MEEAGAVVTDWKGRPHSLESKTIVAANPLLYQEVLSLICDASGLQFSK